MKSGINYFGRKYGRPSENIIFRRNTIGTGHGITIGSEMSGSVRNVTFEDITMEKTGTGIRMKSERGRGGIVEDIVYRRILMKEIEGQCVQVTLNYAKGLKPTNKTAVRFAITCTQVIGGGNNTVVPCTRHLYFATFCWKMYAATRLTIRKRPCS